ncbi:MAG TPA: thiol:disulfide interchange protein DsbA/DsbL [Steroidobacteraceae bacterium]
MTAFRILAAMIVCMLAVPAYSQVENKDYRLLDPAQPTSHSGRVEVIEFFSYGCPHCYAMHPLLKAWAEHLPDNAVLVRVPISLGHREWGQLSRAYYALESMGELARLDDELFKALHEQKRRLYDEDSIVAWAAEQGIDEKKFRAVFNSSEISAKAFRAEEMARNYKVSGVPYLAVAGKYNVLGRTYEEMLANARKLIDKSASEKQASNR